MKRIWTAIIVGTGFFACGPGYADANGLNVEITPFAAYRFGGTFDVSGTSDSYKLDDAPSYGVILNFRQQANTQWEVLYSQEQTEAVFSDSLIGNSRLDIDIHTLQGGGTYQWEGNKVLPYLTLTLGGTQLKASDASSSQSDTFWSGSIGAGLQILPSERLGFRLEIRGYGILMDSDTDLFCRTGPNQNICAVRIDGTLLTQVETLAGIVFRF